MNSFRDQPSILVAEDEMLIAMLLETTLEDAGFRVLMAARVAKGLELIESEQVDAAILDINLAGQNSFGLADALQKRSIPFAFASGYGAGGLPEAYRDAPVLQKPYDMQEIKVTVDELLNRV